MANTVDELVSEFEELIKTLRSMQEKGQKDGQNSLARAVDTQVGILSNALHRSKIDCGAIEYAKKHGTMRPSQVADTLRKIATAIDDSKNPQRKLVAEDILRVITAIG